MTLETNTSTESPSGGYAIRPMEDVHQLACANCGTPLSPNFGKTALICKYCGQRHKFLEPPEESESADFMIGDAVAVEWGGRWWSAHVVDIIQAETAEKRWKVHFEGWAPAFDDVVAEDRIRTIDYEPGDSIIPPPFSTEPIEVERTSALPAILGILALVVGIGFALVWWLSEPVKSTMSAEQIDAATMSGISGPVSNIRVTKETPVKVGQQFHVKWGDQWYMGTAMHVDPTNGEIIIRYNGWGDQYDEVVPRERLRQLK
ncbi:MAG: hypothetical protein JXR76_28470 [Deltaproteobacteria bacterium]|nr:hypothetical protein [Deltaproteobacteria bacterium]